MKVLSPTTVIPVSGSGRIPTKYVEIWKSLENLKDGDWLPVEFETAREASNFRIAAHTHRTLNIDTVSRGRTIFVKLSKSEENGGILPQNKE